MTVLETIDELLVPAITRGERLVVLLRPILSVVLDLQSAHNVGPELINQYLLQISEHSLSSPSLHLVILLRRVRMVEILLGLNSPNLPRSASCDSVSRLRRVFVLDFSLTTLTLTRDTVFSLMNLFQLLYDLNWQRSR